MLNIAIAVSLVSSGFILGSLAFAISSYRKNKKEIDSLIDFLNGKDSLIKRLYNQKLELEHTILEQQNLINNLNEIISKNKNKRGGQSEPRRRLYGC